MQNRVDPAGNIFETKARGAWMGNRGQLHDHTKKILRPFKLKAWITCVLQFKGRRRTVMSPGLYTELFFTDEAVSFAAGHRPCCECRRQDFNRFKMHWIKGNPSYGFTEKTSIQNIDEVIQNERIDTNGHKITYRDRIENLPEGTFIIMNKEPYLVARKHLYQWTPFEYRQKLPSPRNKVVEVLTPRCIVNTFTAGYIPQMAIGIA
jgi:hypothetical protein